MSADITVRRADPAEADLVGKLTERVYRDGGTCPLSHPPPSSPVTRPTAVPAAAPEQQPAA